MSLDWLLNPRQWWLLLGIQSPMLWFHDSASHSSLHPFGKLASTKEIALSLKISSRCTFSNIWTFSPSGLLRAAFTKAKSLWRSYSKYFQKGFSQSLTKTRWHHKKAFLWLVKSCQFARACSCTMFGGYKETLSQTCPIYCAPQGYLRIIEYCGQ